jgi:hypothetical protein
MKSRITLLLLILGLGASSSVAAYAGCRNTTLTGTYAFTVHGQIFPPDGSAPLLVGGVAQTTFDGKGNLVQVDAVAVNGGLAPGWRPGTGTYSLNADCTGTITINNEGMPPLHQQVVIAQSGNTIHGVVIDPGFAVTADAERVRVPKK